MTLPDSGPIFPARESNPFGDPIGPEAVLPLLLDLVEPDAPWVAGLPFEYRPSCPSTNAALKQAAESARTGTAVVTDEQTAGRGRLGRTWMSSPGLDLTFSVLIRPALAPARGHLLSLATGVAVAEVLEGSLGAGGCVALKWPNDVLLNGKKVCGILLETSTDAERIHWAVAGIGLNVNSEPEGFIGALAPQEAAEWQGRPTPVSLKECLGHAVPRAPLLAALLARLTCWWTRLDGASLVPSLLDEWCRRDALAGRQVKVYRSADRSDLRVAGQAVGIGEQGQLLVRSADGTVREIFAGDVSVAAAEAGRTW